MTSKKLSELIPGESGIVEAVYAPPDVADRLLELGIGDDEHIAMIGKAPLGDPIILDLMNYRLSIRKSDAEKVHLKNVQKKNKGNK